MGHEESEVDSARKQALSLLRANVAGPKKYVEMTYAQYHALMDGNASLDVDNFLKHSENELHDFKKVSYALSNTLYYTLAHVLTIIMSHAVDY